MRRVTGRGAFVLALTGCIVVLNAPARAASFECTAVDKRATVYANTTVSISESRAAKTCTFSVNGATGSQPSAEIQGRLFVGFEALRFGQPHNVTLIADVIPHLLVAAGPTRDGTVPRELEDLLRRNRDMLNQCLARFFDPQRPGMELANPREEFSCGFKSKEVADRDILAIFARFASVVNSLFLRREPSQ